MATELAIRESTTVVTITDREGDIYDLLALERSDNSHLLIRGTHNRRADHETKYLKEAIAQTPPSGQLLVNIPRGDDRPSRQATLTIRFATLTVEPPRTHQRRSQLKPVPLQVVLATEENPPQGAKAISWLLLTTITVNSFEEAVRCVRWYSYRWLIERYHYVLKSGCGVEQLQLETPERIQRALATYCIVAWRKAVAHL